MFPTVDVLHGIPTCRSPSLKSKKTHIEAFHGHSNAKTESLPSHIYFHGAPKWGSLGVKRASDPIMFDMGVHHGVPRSLTAARQSLLIVAPKQTGYALDDCVSRASSQAITTVLWESLTLRRGRLACVGFLRAFRSCI